MQIRLDTISRMLRVEQDQADLVIVESGAQSSLISKVGSAGETAEASEGAGVGSTGAEGSGKGAEGSDKGDEQIKLQQAAQAQTQTKLFSISLLVPMSL